MCPICRLRSQLSVRTAGEKRQPCVAERPERAMLQSTPTDRCGQPVADRPAAHQHKQRGKPTRRAHVRKESEIAGAPSTQALVQKCSRPATRRNVRPRKVLQRTVACNTRALPACGRTWCTSFAAQTRVPTKQLNRKTCHNEPPCAQSTPAHS